MEKISDKQSKTIDILKVLFTVFVVYIHADQTRELFFSDGITKINLPTYLSYFEFLVSKVISGCANAGFFLLSSILLYRKEFTWVSNTKKKIRTLVIPYFLANTVIIVIYLVFQNLPFTKQFFGNPDNIILNFTFVGWLKAYGIDGSLPINGPTWFIRNLFILNILSILIKKAIDKYPKMYLAFLVINICINNFTFNGLLQPLYLFFWSLGYYIIKYRNRFKLDIKYIYIYIMYILVLVFKMYVYINNIVIYNVFLQIIDCIYLLISILFWYCVTSRILIKINSNCITALSKYKFLIYIFHVIAMNFISKVVIKILPINPLILLLEYIFIPIITIVLIVVFGMFISRYFPRLYSTLIGSRKN